MSKSQDERQLVELNFACIGDAPTKDEQAALLDLAKAIQNGALALVPVRTPTGKTARALGAIVTEAVEVGSRSPSWRLSKTMIAISPIAVIIPSEEMPYYLPIGGQAMLRDDDGSYVAIGTDDASRSH